MYMLAHKLSTDPSIHHFILLQVTMSYAAISVCVLPLLSSTSSKWMTIDDVLVLSLTLIVILSYEV
jgi:hypothetical protein